MNQASQRFIERMGLNFSDEGVPRIAGRLFALLLLSTSPRSLDDLARSLDVSKASISTNARLLQQWGAIDRVSLPGDRRDYYQIAEDGITRLLQIQIDRLRRMQETIEEARNEIDLQDAEIVRRRLDRIRTFQAEFLDILRALLDRWSSEDPLAYRPPTLDR